MGSEEVHEPTRARPNRDATPRPVFSYASISIRICNLALLPLPRLFRVGGGVRMAEIFVSLESTLF